MGFSPVGIKSGLHRSFWEPGIIGVLVMSIELFNIQLGVNMQRNDVSATNTDVDEEIATLKSVADLSTISFGKSDTAHLSDLNSCMFYHFDRSVYRGLSSVKGFPRGLSNDMLQMNWPCLRNKYLYGFGGGTISYLKAIKSMESSLLDCDKEEKERSEEGGN